MRWLEFWAGRSVNHTHFALHPFLFKMEKQCKVAAQHERRGTLTFLTQEENTSKIRKQCLNSKMGALLQVRSLCSCTCLVVKINQNKTNTTQPPKFKKQTNKKPRKQQTGNKQGLFAPQESFGFCKGLWVAPLPNRRPFFKALKQPLSQSYWGDPISFV